jgi:hypothetical protein
MFDYTMKTKYTNLVPMKVLVHPSVLGQAWRCTQPNRQGQARHVSITIKIDANIY